LPRISPTLLERLSTPFDHADWVFEIKHDGFRAVAYIREKSCELVSRKDHVYSSFAPLCSSLAQLPVRSAILDGEIVCLDGAGRSVFDRLFYRQGSPCFCAFDLLWLDGQDLRQRPLLERKERLQELVIEGLPVLYSDHVAQHGVRFFDLACGQDLEGIVAKHRDGEYGHSWLKIKNPRYTQAIGRSEKFQRRMRA
jgi:bifunctional non-homologous end joining protein LigD